MKALVLEDYNALVYKDVPKPKYEPGEVLIQVKACGICGSDVHGIDGSSGRRIPPLIMGHEASGVIAEIGCEVKNWRIGDRVTFDSTIYKLEDWYTRKGLYNLSEGRIVLGVSPGEYCRHGAFAEYVAIPQHVLYKIPDTVSFTQAAMVEPVAVALHAVGLTPISVNDSAVVVGVGMIGSFIVQALRAAGCGKIIVVDLEPERLELAGQLGADLGIKAGDDVPEKIKELTHGRGADVAFEAVGIDPTVQTAIDSVRRGGTITLVGNLTPNVNLPLQKVVTQQLRLQGSCAICGEYPAALEMIERGEINVDAILSAEVSLTEGAKWFQRLYDKEKGLVKVILNP
ncbi:TPA: galactitol-1-phosphate 5-dehydrogenase [Candidatus Poribacteria bacterium]|nr:galactitol-1-phosphate 5-dehydrogenase [Candidatus Poribacteria bacterium]HIC17581.1 galactitol-1-phosphate 5-dehydrogenase [Candidatus Poribacteria bacterium]HIO09821.1 galactitol-1-phosphate 5-dehydrogenase [Candidatus Poribacteria bacterium]